MDEDLFKNIDAEKIAKEGTKIYEEIKSKYIQQNTGKYLAIEIDSKDVFLADNAAEAVQAAKKVHPNKIFFVVKIGYSAAEILSNMEKNTW
ncbi:MAG: hypothetical protein AAB352_02830 [Patescibacteria group bacterium]